MSDLTDTIRADAAVEIQGTVSVVHFAKASFSAGRLRGRGRDISFSVAGFVKVGEPVTIRGKWENHPQYGRQFKGSEIIYTLPADAYGLAKWLEWNVPCVGPVKAQKLIDEYGLELPRMAAEDPQQVAIHAHIAIESIHRIAEQWSEFSKKIAAISELAKLGLTQNQVELIYAKFKGSSITILQEDPYLLLREIDGFGFKTVDEIARKVGIPESHPGRKQAALITAVYDARDKGSTAVRETRAIEDACNMLEFPVEAFSAAVVEQSEKAARIGRVKREEETKENVQWLGVPASFAHERLIWDRLQMAADPNPHAGRVDAAFVAENYGEIGDKKLDSDQLSAVVAAVSNRITFITGGAGAGKTLVARSITKAYTDAEIDVHLCAPTGKAARRLTEVIGGKHVASTIHRMLGYKPTGGFFHDALNPLPDGVIIVDEISMVDSSLAYHLFRAISPRSAIVCIGDPNQLPPVGAGAMLRDVLANNLAPIGRLSHCHRQAGSLKANCTAILGGKVEPAVLGDDESGATPWMIHDGLIEPKRVVKAITRLFDYYLPRWGYDSIHDIQFLTAMHGGELGTRYLNRVCQWLNQKRLGVILDEPTVGDDTRPTLYVGDKVIHTKNNYKLDVMNGTQGTVKSVGKFLVVGYDDKEVSYDAANKGEVELSYVITPHRAQGSEWPCVVVVCHKKHSFMQTRNWLYTGCTRAQKTCVLIGDAEGMRRAAENDKRDHRTTWLDVWGKSI